LKAYGELPQNAKINETDIGGEENGDVGFEFDDVSDASGDESGKDIDIDNI
jgi:translation initiation factor 1A